MPDKLVFRHVDGERQEAEVSAYGTDGQAGEYLLGRAITLEDGHELRQHRPVSGPRRNEGYERLDNEILAGRRLYEVAQWPTYPREVAELYGDEATSAEPFVLFEPYQGLPLRDVGSYIGEDEFGAFAISFLTGLSWIAAAGIAHRAIGPDTVFWDTGRGALITDFSRSSIFGVPRTQLAGPKNRVPPELRPGSRPGTVGPRDDIWAAGRLIFYVRNQGEDVTDRGQLAELDELFNGLFDPVFGPPDGRPTARELLEDGLRQQVAAPSARERSDRLITGRQTFLEVRDRKHPGAATPSDLNADIDWMGDDESPPAPANGNRRPPADLSGDSNGSAYPPMPAIGSPQEDELAKTAKAARPFRRKRG